VVAFEPLRDRLPQGGELPVDEWARRHRSLTYLLWASAAILAIFSYVAGYSAVHIVLHFAALVPLALAAASSGLPQKARTVACSIGLLTVSALGVHSAGGVIEAHFAFFVVVVLLMVYEDWTVFALAVGYVLVHHGLLGMIDASQVFHNPDQYAHPWKWATIHAIFVAAAGVAGIITWRLNEDVRRRMRHTQDQLQIAATTDALTGLGNRRRLLVELEDAMSVPGMRLCMFDLDGFKAYNDSFGHQAGDALLVRLGLRLRDAVAPAGEAYRLGGDEFCILTVDPGADEVCAAAGDALTEHGEAFEIGNSYGSVDLTDDVETADQALLLADRRMYHDKNGGRMSAGRQSADVLLRALAERSPELVYHVGGVAETAQAVARELGVPEDELPGIRQAAELHDIGKVAIPDAILGKPGPLDEQEWEFVRRHTVIGERIIAAAPALSFIAKLVRHSHERWDGDGYPERLAGEAIPLGSRIVAVCDAFDAIISERPYRAARNFAEGLAELSRCAGSQFDPAVVAAFITVVSRPDDPPSDDRNPRRRAKQLHTAAPA
jgi:diguanylate cyclase (GGDEF)-like protein